MQTFFEIKTVYLKRFVPSLVKNTVEQWLARTDGAVRDDAAL